MRSAAMPNGIVMIRMKQMIAASRYARASQIPASRNQMMLRIRRISAVSSAAARFSKSF
jgi:hypothetical protein